MHFPISICWTVKHESSIGRQNFWGGWYPTLTFLMDSAPLQVVVHKCLSSQISTAKVSIPESPWVAPQAFAFSVKGALLPIYLRELVRNHSRPGPFHMACLRPLVCHVSIPLSSFSLNSCLLYYAVSLVPRASFIKFTLHMVSVMPFFYFCC